MPLDMDVLSAVTRSGTRRCRHRSRSDDRKKYDGDGGPEPVVLHNFSISISDQGAG
jgi:hypothetical protein